MSAINFGGLASGLDTNLIVESLLANQQRRVDNINSRITEQETRKRAFNDVKTSLSTFKGIVDSFTEDVFKNRDVSSGDESIITATADENSAIGEYEIEVEQLAKRSSVSVGAALNSATAQIGAGTLTLDNDGGGSFAVTLADGASTLTDLKQAINDQHGDSLQASIIEVSTGSFQLVVSTKETGASLNIRNDADPSPSTLSGFTDNGFDLGGINTEQAGQDARIVLNGVTITRAYNEIDDVLEGVTLDLKKAEDNTKIKLSIEKNLDDAVKQFEELAKGFNDVLGQINRVTNTETGVLRGDTDLLRLKRELQSSITRFVPNSDKINIRDDSSIGYTSLSQLGFKTDSKDGKLSVDSKTIRTALEDNFNEVKNLFMGNHTSSNANVSLGVNGASYSGQILLDTVNDQATVGGETFSLDRNGTILSFQTDSAYSGISFLDNVGNDSNVTFELSAGLGAFLEKTVNEYTSFSGLINSRTSSIDDSTRSLEKDLGRAQDRLGNQKQRLTGIFAKAEQAISTLNGLQSSLGAQTIGR